MLRRLPTAILLIVGLLGAAAHAAGDPVRPSIASVSLSGGFSVRNTTYERGDTQGRTTQISGTSLWLFRIRADWFPIRWLGVEGDGSGDLFRALKPTPNKDPLQNASQRGAARLAVALRYVTDSGFVLNGSLGYGFSIAPVVRIDPLNLTGEPRADGLLSHGPMARLGVGYSGERFEGLASVIAMFGFGQRVNSLEPQLWLAGRVADVGPTALWVGLEAGLLLEGSPADVRYGGPTFRFALGVKLQILPPAPPPKPIVDGLKSETTLLAQVRLPDGAPALGALVTLDDSAPAPVDAKGELVTGPKPGAHTVSAKLSGYRSAKADAQVVEGKQTLVVLRLEALTGPGQLAGTVRASSNGKPVPEATVTAEGLPPVTTGEDGTYRFEKLGPGPVKVRVEAQGFNPADEIAQVPPESAATLDVQLEALGKGSPATVRGLIRSRTGEALKASVVIKGLATKVQVTPEGRFFVTVPGGTYQFVISAPGYVTQSKKVVLADGDQAIVHTELQKVSK